MTGTRQRRPSDTPLVIIGLILFSGYVAAAAMKGAFAAGALVSIFALSITAMIIFGSLLILRAIATRIMRGPGVAPGSATNRQSAYLAVKQMRADRMALEADIRRRAGNSLFTSKYDHGIIGIDRNGREIILGTLADPIFVPFANLIDAEVITGNVSITKTNRGSQVLGAAVGDLVLGPVGLLTGGLSASKRSRDKLADLAVKVTVEDWDKPVHVVRFLKTGSKGADPNHRSIKPIVEQVDRLYANLVMAMRSQA